VLPEGLDLRFIAKDGQVLNVHKLLQQDGKWSGFFHLVREVELHSLLVVGIVVAAHRLHLKVMRFAR
jgi:hypothetical protein